MRDRRSDRRTDRPTDGPTDGRTTDGREKLKSFAWSYQTQNFKTFFWFDFCPRFSSALDRNQLPETSPRKNDKTSISSGVQKIELIRLLLGQSSHIGSCSFKAFMASSFTQVIRLFSHLQQKDYKRLCISGASSARYGTSVSTQRSLRSFILRAKMRTSFLSFFPSFRNCMAIHWIGWIFGDSWEGL